VNTIILNALAEPNRLRIVELLRDSPGCSVGDIAERLQLRQPQVSKHLHVLHEAGLVGVDARAQQRICRLEGDAFEALERWTRSFKDQGERSARLSVLPPRATDEHDREDTYFEED
jgi:DNA-binding transcriptional ArsR family regulator